jgi:Na+/glutamate symporter
MSELSTIVTGMLADATAVGIALATIGITLGVIALIRRKA